MKYILLILILLVSSCVTNKQYREDMVKAYKIAKQEGYNNGYKQGQIDCTEKIMEKTR